LLKDHALVHDAGNDVVDGGLEAEVRHGLGESLGVFVLVKVERLAAPGGEQAGLVSFVAVNDFHGVVGVWFGFWGWVEGRGGVRGECGGMRMD